MAVIMYFYRFISYYSNAILLIILLTRLNEGGGPSGRGVMVAAAAAAASVSQTTPTTTANSCAMVKANLGAIRLKSSLPERPTTGLICGQNSCCSPANEQDLLQLGQLNVDKFARDSINRLSSNLESRARRFDTFFREMLNSSKLEFHLMFQKTYGKIYLQNADVFSDFFGELETYYRRGSVHLSQTLEQFFGILYQRMFTVLNGQYRFDGKYLECVSQHMVEMRPFGDVPHKLSMQLRRSFVATRAYHRALAHAADIAHKMVGVRLTVDCVRNVMRMQYCRMCAAPPTTPVRSCTTYCTRVMEGCFHYHMQLSAEWDHFIDALDKVAERLMGPYNIELVVEPLNIKISEAIMNFQESGADVTKKIYSLCGMPPIARRRRRDVPVNSTATSTARPPSGTEAFNSGPGAVNSRPPSHFITSSDEDNPMYEIKYEPIRGLLGSDESGRPRAGGVGGARRRKKLPSNPNNSHNMVDISNTMSIERLVRDIRMKVRESRQFWMHLPYQYCNNASISSTSGTVCWNGTVSAVPPVSPTAGTNRAAQTLVSEQINALQKLSEKLRKAHQGEEFDLDNDDTDQLLVVEPTKPDEKSPIPPLRTVVTDLEAGSGSGSGDGSNHWDDDDGGEDDDSDGLGTTDEGVAKIDEDGVAVTTPKSVSSTSDDDIDMVVVPDHEDDSIRFNEIDEKNGARDKTKSNGGNVKDGGKGGAAPSGRLTLNRALLQYMLPVVMVWFGGAVADLL